MRLLRSGPFSSPPSVSRALSARRLLAGPGYVPSSPNVRCKVSRVSTACRTLGPDASRSTAFIASKPSPCSSAAAARISRRSHFSPGGAGGCAPRLTPPRRLARARGRRCSGTLFSFLPARRRINRPLQNLVPPRTQPGENRRGAFRAFEVRTVGLVQVVPDLGQLKGGRVLYHQNREPR
jgi:hypothetical protein